MSASDPPPGNSPPPPGDGPPPASPPPPGDDAGSGAGAGSVGDGGGAALPPRPTYRPGSAQPRLNRPVRERYPQLRPTSGYGDPRIRHTGPGPGAGSEQEPERSSKLTARLAVALTVLVGQLWGLTVIVDEWMKGDTATAWWGAGFLVLSFLVVLGLWLLDPEDR
ncbi:hypothetical protein [Streptomyces sp. FIT100]|uniref:hypothetical protein n=1 Tax=Streptomyces sp. FIT100 TaxID=2837956 RepID=UPI0021C680B2|nr:hypothetical protein [Streptomyces sp. FIT100]